MTSRNYTCYCGHGLEAHTGMGGSCRYCFYCDDYKQKPKHHDTEEDGFVGGE